MRSLASSNRETDSFQSAPCLSRSTDMSATLLDATNDQENLLETSSQGKRASLLSSLHFFLVFSSLCVSSFVSALDLVSQVFYLVHST